MRTKDPARPHVERFLRENAVLIGACGAAPRTPDNESRAALDWGYMLDAANRQGVMPLLADWVKQVAIPIEERWAAELRHAYWANHFRNQVLQSELGRVTSAARAAGIGVMPLKGAALAFDYYASPALRVMSDLDLLVPSRDLGRMAAVMLDLRYRPIDMSPSYVDERWLDAASRDHAWLATRDGLDVLVEYRTMPLEPAVARLTDLDSRFTRLLHEYTEMVWGRARGPAGAEGPRITPEDLLLQVATHLAAKHVDFRLIWLHDLVRLATAAPVLDWEYIARTAARLALDTPVSAALAAAVHWMGAPVAEGDLARVARPLPARGPRLLDRWDRARLRRHVSALGARDLTTVGPAMRPLISALSRLTSARARLRVLRWIALPSRAYLAHRGITAPTGLLGYAAATLRRSRQAAFGHG